MLYGELMHEHGYLLRPGDEGYDEAAANLPCGWPHRPERTPPAARCELTDLPADSCGHCNGAETRAREDRPQLGPFFAAAYPGSCAGCDEPFEAGAMIRADGEGGYLAGASCPGRP